MTAILRFVAGERSNSATVTIVPCPTCGCCCATADHRGDIYFAGEQLVVCAPEESFLKDAPLPPAERPHWQRLKDAPRSPKRRR